MDFTNMEGDEKDYKAWLFKENIKLQAERKALEQEKEALLTEQKKFEKEKKEFQFQMKQWTDRIKVEKERMSQEQKFFDTKFKILENGFKQLAADKERFEYDKKMFETMKKVNSYQDMQDDGSSWDDTEPAVFFFKGVTSSLGLKKRYKDLIKIFHPDNLFGDNETILRINKEYEMMKKKLCYQKRTV